MAMTKREQLGKEQIMRKLNQEGYPTYSEIFSWFDLNLTSDPNVIGYMIPNQAKIVVNEFLDIEQVSTVIRHEILHEFLEHKKRTENLGYKDGFPLAANIAGDYEISNLGYTDRDKKTIRGIRIGDNIVSGLVTEDDHPDWEDKTFEEMFEELMKQDPNSLKNPGIGNPNDGKDSQRGASGQQQLDDAKAAKGKAEKMRKEAESEASSGEGDKAGEKEGTGSSSSKIKYDDEAYKNMSPEEKKKERARRRKEAAKRVEEADKIIDDLNKVMNDIKGKDGEGKSDTDDKTPFDTPEEMAERAERIAKIKEFLDSEEKRNLATSEARAARIEEKAAKAAKDSQKYRSSSLVRFTESLNKFIRDEIARARDASWAKINKKYVNSGLLRPGTTSAAKGKVPKINVYFDRSGSWDKNKTVKGQQAISTLNRYVVRREIVINLYYFNTKVMDTDPGGNGGTLGTPILDHIEQTRPNNVIVLTDDDIGDCSKNVEVDGGVWMLFYGGRSKNLMEHLGGRRLNKYFDVE